MKPYEVVFLRKNLFLVMLSMLLLSGSVFASGDDLDNDGLIESRSELRYALNYWAVDDGLYHDDYDVELMFPELESSCLSAVGVPSEAVVVFTRYSDSAYTINKAKCRYVIGRTWTNLFEVKQSVYPWRPGYVSSWKVGRWDVPSVKFPLLGEDLPVVPVPKPVSGVKVVSALPLIR